jgi:glycosyltransferase involved in cell wall biosynthesis
VSRPHLIDVWAPQRHYADHVVPIYDELARRGVPARLLLPADRDWHLDADTLDYDPSERVPHALADADGPILTAGYGDSRSVRPFGRPVALWNHGSGQTYLGGHPSYSGGGDRRTLALHLEPGPHAADATRASLPLATVVECGPAKLDRYRDRQVPPLVDGKQVVAVAWHWRCRVAPETGTAFDDWADELAGLAASGRYHILGHGHPLAWDEYDAWYAEHGIERVRDFAEVLDRAHLLVHDASSVGFEAAAVGLPVLTLNARAYRKAVHHGLRFWDAVPGIQGDPGDALAELIAEALADPPHAQQARAHGVGRAYGTWDFDGAARAADALDALRIATDPGPWQLTGPHGSVEVSREMWDLLTAGVLIRQGQSTALVPRSDYGERWAPQGWRRA